jgi:hypothetical protein
MRHRARALELLADRDTRAAIGRRNAALDGERGIAAAELDNVTAQLTDLEVKYRTGETIQQAYDAAKPHCSIALRRVAGSGSVHMAT